MYYAYHQNNAGGRFVQSSQRGVGVVTIIEAPDRSAANARLKEIAGPLAEDRCDCCGPRFYFFSTACPWEMGTPNPTVDDLPIAEYLLTYALPGEQVYLHHADGSVGGWAKPGTLR